MDRDAELLDSKPFILEKSEAGILKQFIVDISQAQSWIELSDSFSLKTDKLEEGRSRRYEF